MLVVYQHEYTTLVEELREAHSLSIMDQVV